MTWLWRLVTFIPAVLFLAYGLNNDALWASVVGGLAAGVFVALLEWEAGDG